MTTKQETALAVKGRVESRVAMSGALLERMGYTVEQYERVVPERAAGIAGVGGMHAAINGHSDHALHNGGADTRRQRGSDCAVQRCGNADTDG